VVFKEFFSNFEKVNDDGQNNKELGNYNGDSKIENEL
jgi:hypothetical protein